MSGDASMILQLPDSHLHSICTVLYCIVFLTDAWNTNLALVQFIKRADFQALQRSHKRFVKYVVYHGNLI